MLRFALALLLALSLWPPRATADTGAPVPGRDELWSAAADYGADVLRSPGGFELLRTLDVRTLERGGSCSHRSDRNHSRQNHVLSGFERFAAHARLLVAPTRADAGEVVTPLCERLPYFATAPPSAR